MGKYQGTKILPCPKSLMYFNNICASSMMIMNATISHDQIPHKLVFYDIDPKAPLSNGKAR